MSVLTGTTDDDVCSAVWCHGFKCSCSLGTGQRVLHRPPEHVLGLMHVGPGLRGSETLTAALTQMAAGRVNENVDADRPEVSVSLRRAGRRPRPARGRLGEVAGITGLTGWVGIVLNAPDAGALAYFYRDLFGWPRTDDEPDWCTIRVACAR